MSDDLLDQLAAYGRFHRLHQNSVTVAEVAEPSARLPLDAEPQHSRRPRRWLVAAAAVVAAMVLVAGIVLLQETRDDHIRSKPAAPGPAPTTTPPSENGVYPLENGFYRRLDGTLTTEPYFTPPGYDSSTGPLVPEGEPTSPETGELVAAIWLRHRNPLSYRLYADGRLLRAPNANPVPGWSGWVEQRLTPDGVERVRNLFLGSRLFDSARPVNDVVSGCGFVQACVRAGDHWLSVQVDVGGASASQASGETVQLYDQLRLLDSDLPANEWADQEIKPYVPARIAACVQVFVAKDGTAIEVPTDISILLPQFPPGAAELLAAREPMGTIPGIEDYGGVCAELTRDEARRLADELLAPSGGGSHEYGGIVVEINDLSDASPLLANGFPHRGVTREGTFAHISFKQLLPDAADAITGD